MKPGAVLFDVFGTVVDWRGSLTRQFVQFGKAHGLTADWERLVIQWRAAYQPALQEVRGGRRPFVDLDILHREMLDRLLPTFRLSALDDANRDRMVRGWHRRDAWPDAVAGLKGLKSAFIRVHINGQTQAKSLPDETAATRHAKVQAMIDKGCWEIGGKGRNVTCRRTPLPETPRSAGFHHSRG